MLPPKSEAVRNARVKHDSIRGSGCWQRGKIFRYEHPSRPGTVRWGQDCGSVPHSAQHGSQALNEETQHLKIRAIQNASICGWFGQCTQRKPLANKANIIHAAIALRLCLTYLVHFVAQPFHPHTRLVNTMNVLDIEQLPQTKCSLRPGHERWYLRNSHCTMVFTTLLTASSISSVGPSTRVPLAPRGACLDLVRCCPCLLSR